MFLRGGVSSDGDLVRRPRLMALSPPEGVSAMGFLLAWSARPSTLLRVAWSLALWVARLTSRASVRGEACRTGDVLDGARR